MTEEKKNLFDTLWDMTEELKKKFKKPIVMRQLKRRLQSARDNALEKLDAEQRKLDGYREDISNVESYNINGILESKAKIRELNQVVEDIKEEYAQMFGKEMREEEE